MQIRNLQGHKEIVDRHVDKIDQDIVQKHTKLSKLITRLKNTYAAEKLAGKAKLLLKTVEQIESYVDNTHTFQLKILNPLALSMIQIS